jgi:hypothetical protein
MPTTTKRGSTSKKAAKPAPPPEPEENEDDDLEELEEDEVQEKPAKRGNDDVVFGVADLAKLLSKGQKKPVTTRELRQLIRKMAREDKPRVQREITAGNRSRYSWSGPDHPEVKAIIAAFNGGELEADKRAKLAELKDRKGAKAETKPAQTRKASKKAAAPVEEDDVEELELDDEDDEE